jgi:hypothetical protein
MKNKTNPSDTQDKKHPYAFTPLITTVAFPLLIGRQKNTESTQEKLPENKKSKSKSLTISKYEVSDNEIKFFDARGFPKKRWVLIKEVPIQEISGIESFGNELKITWNEEVYTFVSKKNSESVTLLFDQIQNLLKDRKKTIENNEKSYLRKNDLRKVMDTIDLSFDILMGLNEKAIDWIHLEDNTAGLLDSWKNYEGAPLNLDFANVSSAIKRRNVEETSREAYGILKSVYEYFDGLKPLDYLKDDSVNVPIAKNLILTYYMLNDVLFGKVVGEEDNEKEILALEGVLLDLAIGSNVKFNIEELKSGIIRLGAKVDCDRVFNDIRVSFKEKLSLL